PCATKRWDTVGHSIATPHRCCHCAGFSMLRGLQRRHMGSTIVGTLGLTNSIRWLAVTHLWIRNDEATKDFSRFVLSPCSVSLYTVPLSVAVTERCALAATGSGSGRWRQSAAGGVRHGNVNRPSFPPDVSLPL